MKEFLGSSKREKVPVRWEFVQQRSGDRTFIKAPLAVLTTRGVASAIEQYLLLLARGAGRPTDVEGQFDHSVALPDRAWSRALGLGEEDPGIRTVRRNWQALKRANLVTLKRKGRITVVTPLKEDGSTDPYVHPAIAKDNYLQVPYVLWLDGYADNLATPAWAMLLIALSLQDWFPLPQERGPEWYFIGESTIERGVRDLRHKGLLQRKYQHRGTFLDDKPWTRENRYRLCPPLGPKGRAPAKGTRKELRDEPKPPAAPKPSTNAEGGDHHGFQ